MIVAIIQARMGSTRLPGKVLKRIERKPMLLCVINRLKYSKYIHNIIVATTTKPEDNKIVELANKSWVRVNRGSEEDVLDRYYQTAVKYKADIIVRITSDCPLVDPKVVDKTIKYFLDNKLDYATNQPTYPDGFDVEVFSFDALQQAWEETGDNEWYREHVTPWMQEYLPKVGELKYTKDFSGLHLFSVDTPEDLELVRKIYRKLGNRFTMENVLEFMEERNEPK